MCFPVRYVMIKPERMVENMHNEYYLMLEDQPVLYFNFDDIEVKIINRNLLPFIIRNRIMEPDVSDLKTYFKENSKNISYIKDYASSRLLSLSRENAKQIYAACNLSQDNSIENRLHICFSCKGVSLNDSYWFRHPDSDEKWKDVDIRHRHLSEIVDVALAGETPSITTDPVCPELTTKGLFRKAWIRQNDTLYLLKSDRTNSFVNTKAEILSSRFLDCTDVPHVRYENGWYKDIFVSKCPNFVQDGMSFVEAHEVISYCRDLNMDFSEFALKKFGKDFANIAIIDYILQNTDRHDQNYGFLMDNRTGELCSVAPLFDHNQALVADFMDKDVTDTLSQMLGEKLTIKETLDKFAPYAGFHFSCAEWDRVKEQNPGYKNVFSGIESRMKDIRCIQNEINPRQELEFQDMLDDIKRQRQYTENRKETETYKEIIKEQNMEK